MRKLLLAVTALLAVAVPITVSAAPSEAATTVRSPQCMTKTEWYKIKAGFANPFNPRNGTTRARVTQIVDIPGKVTDSTDYGGGEKEVWVSYRQCLRDGKPSGPWDTVEVHFGKWNYNATPTHLGSTYHVYTKGAWDRPWGR